MPTEGRQPASPLCSHAQPSHDLRRWGISMNRWCVYAPTGIIYKNGCGGIFILDLSCLIYEQIGCLGFCLKQGVVQALWGGSPMVEGQRGGPEFAAFRFFFFPHYGNCSGLGWVMMSAYLKVSTQGKGTCLMTPSALSLCIFYSFGPGDQIVWSLCVLRNNSSIPRDFSF